MILVNNTSSMMSYKQHDLSEATSSTCGLRTITHTTNMENVAHLWGHLLARHTNYLSQDSVANCPTIDEFCQGLLHLSDASPPYQIKDTWENRSSVISVLHLVPGNTGHPAFCVFIRLSQWQWQPLWF
jgi:hypothetical protein